MSLGNEDKISKEMKLVAIAIFGERLIHDMPDAQDAIKSVAAAIATDVWPDSIETQQRFIGMCLSEVIIEK